jgi:predicted GTPase
LEGATSWCSIVDGREGLVPGGQRRVRATLRPLGVPPLLAVNKTDDSGRGRWTFMRGYRYGRRVSGRTRDGVGGLLDDVIARLPRA